MTSTEEVRAKRAEYMREWRKRWSPEERIARLAHDSKRGMIYQKTERGRQVFRASQKRFREKCRAEVLAHYGTRCACCGENEYEFLTIDHIIPAKHRTSKADGNQPMSAQKLVMWLRRNNYPEGYQVLCYNCNCAKRTEGECPHRRLAMTKFTLLRLLSGGEANQVSNSSGGVK